MPALASRPSRRLLGFAAALALAAAGCNAPAAPVASKPPAAKVLPAGVLAVHTLSGRVTAPASLIGNNGGGVISNNGSGVISNNGSGVIANNGAGLAPRFALAALPEQQPVAGLELAVLDAAGAPVLADGKPVTVKTDADGRYKLTAKIPLDTLVLAGQLAGDRGRLQAVIPRVAKAEVDVDLVSSLTTGYVVNEYVASQPDPTETFNRLTTDAERGTRDRGGEALAADPAAPEALDAARTKAAVERLRKGSPAFDRQLEEVRRLLIPAGQSDLGNLSIATEVSLGRVVGLVAREDGSVYIACGDDRRVWRRRLDGVLENAAGSGAPTARKLDGLAGPAAGLDTIVGIGFDGEGGMWILEHPSTPATRKAFGARITRLGPDGRLREVARVPERVYAIAPQPDGSVHLWASGAYPDLVRSLGDGKFERIYPENGPGALLIRAAAGGEPTRRPISDALNQLLPATRAFAWDAGGRTFLKAPTGRSADGGLLAEDDPSVSSLDAATGEATLVVPRPGDRLERSGLMDGGTILLTRNDAADELQLPDGSRTPLVERPGPGDAGNLDDADIRFVSTAMRVAGPDGATYAVRTSSQTFGDDLPVEIGQRFAILRGKGGAFTYIAGQARSSARAADELALVSPGGGGLLPTGELVLADQGGNRIFRIGAGGKVTAFMGNGQAMSLSDLPDPTRLQVDSDGAVYVEAGRGNGDLAGSFRTIFTKAKDGSKVDLLAKAGWEAGSSPELKDFACAAPGRLIVLAAGEAGATILYAVQAGRRPGEIARLPGLAGEALAMQADDTAWLLEPDNERGKLSRVPPGGQPALVAEDALLSSQFPRGFGAFRARDMRPSLALGPDGTVYVATTADAHVLRVDPANGAVKIIAGEGGVIFAGDGVDDSIFNPGHLFFDAAGNLVFTDRGHKQLKRIPKRLLGG